MDNFFVMDHHLHNEGHPHQPHVKMYHPRADPTNLLTDYEFKRHFRFDKASGGKMLNFSSKNFMGVDFFKIMAQLDNFVYGMTFSLKCGVVAQCHGGAILAEKSPRWCNNLKRQCHKIFDLFFRETILDFLSGTQMGSIHEKKS